MFCVGQNALSPTRFVEMLGATHQHCMPALSSAFVLNCVELRRIMLDFRLFVSVACYIACCVLICFNSVVDFTHNTHVDVQFVCYFSAYWALFIFLTFCFNSFLFLPLATAFHVIPRFLTTFVSINVSCVVPFLGFFAFRQVSLLHTTSNVCIMHGEIEFLQPRSRRLCCFQILISLSSMKKKWKWPWPWELHSLPQRIQI